MNILELGAIGELLGGLAVIGSLIYVGIQVRHNARSVEAATHVQMLQATSAMNVMVVGHDDVADLVRRGQDDPASLTPTEWARFVEFAYMRFGVWEAAFLNHSKGTIDRETWLAWDGGSRNTARGPGYERFWAEHGNGMAPSFQRYVERDVILGGNPAG